MTGVTKQENTLVIDDCVSSFMSCWQWWQDMGSLSDSCKEELTIAAQNTQGFEETQRKS